MTSSFFPTRRQAVDLSIPGQIGRLWVGAVQSWRTRRAMRAMDELSDAGLHDIGITRGEIEHAARFGRPSRP